MTSKQAIKEYFDQTAPKRLKWNTRNRFYHKSLEQYFSFIIPEGSCVLELGCGTGNLLAAVKPDTGIGVDFSKELLLYAEKNHPHLTFINSDAEEINDEIEVYLKNQKFDYIILSDLLQVLWDVQKVIHNLRKFSHPGTRIVISNYNFLWEPLLKTVEKIGLKEKSPNSNWLSYNDIVNVLELEGFQVITDVQKILLPFYFPVLNFIFNKFIVNLPLLNNLGLVNIITAKPVHIKAADLSVSIIIPARNERGNIQNAIERIPAFGKSQELIFIEGHSSDGTYEEIVRVKEENPAMNIHVLKQSEKGKGNAVREGFEKATGDILMILDADLTTPPEDLPKFYNAIAEGKGEFINGCRLVYPMEKDAMRFLNLLGNKFFSLFFSYLLDQRLKDTLCGTKVLFKSDYEKIKKNRAYFGDFDPFGDFDLIFGAAKLNLKITEIIVRYKDRLYGSTQINRFRHGLLLIRMSFFAAFKIKFK
jgi:ubiquinone/menaquinone biosynthesis C-methylase UbiE